MPFQVLNASRAPELRELAQQLQNKPLSEFTGLFNISRKNNPILQNGFINIVRVFEVLPKRDTSTKELEQADAQGPDVCVLVVPFANNGLWRHVVRRADQRVGPALVDFGGAKVDQLHVASDVYHYVRRLQVTVYDVPLVQVLQGQDQAADVEQTVVVGQKADVLENRVELKAVNVLQQEVNSFGVFEGFYKFDYKRTVDHPQDLTFLLFRGYLDVLLDHQQVDFSPRKDFQSVELRRVLDSDQVDPGVDSFAQSFDHF